MYATDNYAIAVGTLLGVYLLIVSIESIVFREMFSNGGLLGWDVLSMRFTSKRTRNILGIFFSYPNILVLTLARLLFGTILLFGIYVPRPLFPFAVIGCALTSIAISFRNRFGGDGADQMALIAIVALALGYGIGSELAISYALGFIAFQVAFAYTTSGIAKLTSTRWRTGEALLGILSTRTYGTDWICLIISRFSVLPIVLSWLAMLTLVAFFPLCVLLPDTLIGIPLFFGLSFHIFNAFVLRLHTFVWAFVAGYPAICFIKFHWQL